MSVTGFLAAAGVVGFATGLGIAMVAWIGIVASIRDDAQRARAVGFVFLGFFIAVLSASLMLLSALGDRLPVAAGIPAVVVLLVLGFRLRRAAWREFERSRSGR